MTDFATGQGAKLVQSPVKELLDGKKNFAFETTASGTNYIKYLEEAKKQGYEIHLTFLWLASAEQAIQRVAQRVKQGGHHIPEETIYRRYYSGIRNLFKWYLPIADSANIMDNSSEESLGRIIARKCKNGLIEIQDEGIWAKMGEAASERRI